MSRVSRNYSQSGVYHILFRGVNRQSIFEEKTDYDKLKETILKVKEESFGDVHFLARFLRGGKATPLCF